MSEVQAGPAGLPAAQPGIARVGKYLMLDLLGEGAFGKVRLAVDESSGKQYAMKIMAKSHIKAHELTLQVRREIAVMKAMRHPNIVNLHEVLTSSKNLYMVMDLVIGGELFDAVADAGRLSEARTRLYFQQLVDGIQYCHSRHVYHRDLKPENLLLSGDKQTLKITDFGLSSIKAQNASSELLHTIMGSPHYIAPEIITSATEGYEGSKVDVWAAGVILFGMLAGFLPFDEQNTKDLYKAIVHSPIQYPPHFSYDVIKLLRSMLQKDPNRRPSMEQIKGFAWFKVDYEPAMVPELTQSSSMEVKPKKTRSKPKKNSERNAKLKRRDQSADRESRRSTDKASRKAVDRSRSNKQCDAAWRSGGRQASKQRSGLFGSRSRNNSISSEQFSERGSIDASDNIACNPADPHHPKEDHRELQPGPGNSARTSVDRAQLEVSPRASITSADHGDGFDNLSEGHASQKEERDTGTFVSLPTDQSAPDSAPCSWSSAVANTGPQEIEGLELQQEIEDDSFTPRGSEASSSSSGRKISINDAARAIGADPALYSPLTPGESRFSPMKSGSTSYMLEGRRRESLRFSGPVLNTNRSGLSDFISPISLQSQASFRSPHAEGVSRPPVSPNYDSLIPQLLQTPNVPKEKDVQTEGEGGKNIGFSDLEHKQEQVKDEVPEEAKPSNLNPAQHYPDLSIETELDGGDEEESIFRPMKSMFAMLAKRASEEMKPSRAPSVYCPEVDNGPESGPQWCLDSMEVFADIEGEDCDVPKTRMTPSRKMLSILEERRNSNKGETGASLDSFTGMQRSIFSPLDDRLAFKLHPSLEAEAEATKAIRKLPVLKPAV